MAEQVPRPDGVSVADVAWLGGGVLLVAALAWFLIRRGARARAGLTARVRTQPTDPA